MKNKKKLRSQKLIRIRMKKRSPSTKASNWLKRWLKQQSHRGCPACLEVYRWS